MRNAATALARPRILADYGSWLLQRAFASKGPSRHIAGITIGGFNGFSEYHSMPRGVSFGEIQFLRNCRLVDGAIVDIGANLGLFSLVMAKAHPARRVLAFEPASSTFAALTQNVALNGADVDCFQMALADHVGTSEFIVRESARANSSLVSNLVLPNEQRIKIHCTTLDRFVEEHAIDRIALLKIDVEGFEASVIKGSGAVLSRMRPPIIYFEVCATLAQLAGFAPEEAAAEIERHGYRLHRIGDGGELLPVSLSRISKVRAENWVATSS